MDCIHEKTTAVPREPVADAPHIAEPVVAPPIEDGEVDIDLHALAVEMSIERRIWKLSEEENMYFYTHLRGDVGVHRAGSATSRSTTFARQSAMEFCRRYNWPREKGFSYRLYGGVHGSAMLSREWARLGHYYMCIWIENCEDVAFIFDLVNDKAPDDLPFLDWAVTVDADSDTFNRIMEVREAFPRS